MNGWIDMYYLSSFSFWGITDSLPVFVYFKHTLFLFIAEAKARERERERDCLIDCWLIG